MMFYRAAIAAAFLLLPEALLAQTPATGQGRLEIVGETLSACVIRGPAAANASNAAYSATGPSSGQIRITEMVDPASARARATSVDLALAVVCNSPHRLVLRSDNGGLLRAGAAAGSTGQGGFAELLPYELQASWLGQNVASASNAGGPLILDSMRGGAGQLSLAIQVRPGGNPLVAGDYRDAVIVEFRAAN